MTEVYLALFYTGIIDKDLRHSDIHSLMKINFIFIGKIRGAVMLAAKNPNCKSLIIVKVIFIVAAKNRDKTIKVL